MAAFSKLLPYTCYELGHTWHPSCTKCSFDMFISSGIASLQIYGFVYMLTVLSSRKKLSKKYSIQVIKNYCQSVLFLAFNGSFFVACFCLLRRLFCSINFISAGWGPGFLGSYLAILVERPSRRTLLAIYVSNVASECFWNVLKARGYVTPIPNGEILVFAASMALFGYFFKSSARSSSLVDSVFRFILGNDESMKKMEENSLNRNYGRYNIPLIDKVLKLLDKPGWKHSTCPHEGPCIKNAVKGAAAGLVKGYLLQFGFKFLTSFVRILKQPVLLWKALSSEASFQMALFLGWFSSVFKITCCVSRWFSNKDRAVHGAIAGVLASIGMKFYSAPSLALYALWKALEVMYSKGIEDGVLPSVPYGVELLYAFSTAYLFHVAIYENFNMKPSYWSFLMKLTAGRIAGFNRTILNCYGLDSGRKQAWPSYRMDALSDKFIEKYYKSIG